MKRRAFLQLLGAAPLAAAAAAQAPAILEHYHATLGPVVEEFIGIDMGAEEASAVAVFVERRGEIWHAMLLEMGTVHHVDDALLAREVANFRGINPAIVLDPKPRRRRT